MFKKLKTVRKGGVIEDHFRFLGKNYVTTRTDPKSNYLMKVRNDLRDIKNPYERILVDLVWKALYN